jgi:hypothetical protein
MNSKTIKTIIKKNTLIGQLNDEDILTINEEVTIFEYAPKKF